MTGPAASNPFRRQSRFPCAASAATVAMNVENIE
jgi:hypothetical protein